MGFLGVCGGGGTAPQRALLQGGVERGDVWSILLWTASLVISPAPCQSLVLKEGYIPFMGNIQKVHTNSLYCCSVDKF